MEERMMGWIFALEVLLLGGIWLALPKIGRRGLLFGVYVGEQECDSDAAAAIRARWYRWIAIATALCFVAAAAVAASGANPLIAVVPEFALIVAGIALYLRSYRAARVIARESSSLERTPPAAASLSVPTGHSVLPWVAILAAVVCGVFVI